MCSRDDYMVLYVYRIQDNACIEDLMLFQNPLSGKINSIPLVIEDEKTSISIKKSNLYLLTQAVSREKEGFQDISVTAACPEGTFDLLITKESCLEAINGGNYTDDQKFLIVQTIFPIDGDRDLKCTELDLALSAKYISNSKYYDKNTKELIDSEDLPLTSDSVTLYIKTKAILPQIIGRFSLKYTVSNSTENGRDASMNLFSWMDLLINERNSLSSKLEVIQDRFEKLRKENSNLEEELEVANRENVDIINDFQDKFLQVLSAKKEKVRQLMEESGNVLASINNEYSTKNRLNLRDPHVTKKVLPDTLASVYINQRKRKPSPQKIHKQKRQKEAKPSPFVSENRELKTDSNMSSDVPTPIAKSALSSPSSEINNEVLTDADIPPRAGAGDLDTEYSSEEELTQTYVNHAGMVANSRTEAMVVAESSSQDSANLQSEEETDISATSHSDSS